MNLEKGEIAISLFQTGNDSYALADNAIYSICRDDEEMWIGFILAGSITIRVNGLILKNSTLVMILKILGVGSQFCESNDGTFWIGTEDKGLFHFYPESGKIEKFSHPAIIKMFHGLCNSGGF